MLAANTPTLCGSSVHLVGASPDLLGMRVLNILILERPECPPDPQDQSLGSSVHSAPIVELGGGPKMHEDSNKFIQSSDDSPVQSAVIEPVESAISKSSTATCNLDGTKFDILLKTVLKLQQE